MANGTRSVGRTFVFFASFLGAVVIGGWLGLILDNVANYLFASPFGPPPPSGDLTENLFAASVAGAALAGVSILVHQASSSEARGSPNTYPRRGSVEGASSRNEFLYTAAFSALVALLSVEGSPGRVSPLSLWPALLVALLYALAITRRSPRLRFAGLVVGSLYTIGVLVIALARAF